MAQKTVNKGQNKEEVLREYFLDAGYYVARGVPFKYKEFDITDIDLWLYGRTSSITREMTIVDIKNKRTPQAIERIFWVQGLKSAVKATKAIVATSDNRPAIKEFGRQMETLVLDGNFFNRVSDKYKGKNDRLSDEEFISLVSKYSLGKLDGDWIGRISRCKSLLVGGLSYDKCNEWLKHIHFFAEQSITKPGQKEVALRCLYLVCSFLTVAVDFLSLEISFLPQEERIQLFKDGFTFGSKGKDGMNNIINLALGLVEQNATNGNQISNQVRASIDRNLASLDTQILGEYFSKIDISKNLFMMAREFEMFAMSREFSNHSHGTVYLRGLLLCLLDFCRIDRLSFS